VTFPLCFTNLICIVYNWQSKHPHRVEHINTSTQQPVIDTAEFVQLPTTVGAKRR